MGRSFSCEMEQRVDTVQNTPCGWLEPCLGSHGLGAAVPPSPQALLAGDRTFSGPLA